MSVTARRVVAALAVCVLAAAVAAGLLLIDAPGTARAKRLDEIRAQDLAAIADEIAVRWPKEGERLPDGLGAVRARSTDPETGVAYGYKTLGARRFELCASFSTDGEHALRERRMTRRFDWDAAPVSGAGRQCFEITLSD